MEPFTVCKLEGLSYSVIQGFVLTLWCIGGGVEDTWSSTEYFSISLKHTHNGQLELNGGYGIGRLLEIDPMPLNNLYVAWELFE